MRSAGCPGFPMAAVAAATAARAGSLRRDQRGTSTIDPDSYFGFSAKIEDFTYKYLGEKQMLACVHAKFSPEQPCPADGGHSICPEDWEMRHMYIVEADEKPGHHFCDSEAHFLH